MIKNINDIVKKHILKAKIDGLTKKNVLQYYAINNKGFASIINDLKPKKWFRLKSLETIADIVQKSLAKQIHMSY